MKINDKVIVAFMVSMGLFTTKYAKDYVKSLSAKDKTSFFVLLKDNNKNLMLCDRSPEPGITHTSETKTKFVA